MTTIGVVPALSQVAEGTLGSTYLTFDDLLARYVTELYRFVTRLTCDRTEANDLYQLAVRTAYRAFGRLDGATNYRVLALCDCDQRLSARSRVRPA